MVLCVDYIALAIGPLLGPCYRSLVEPACRWTFAHHTLAASGGERGKHVCVCVGGCCCWQFGTLLAISLCTSKHS